MSEITAALVKELRDATNVSMMECKRALVEAGGDMNQAARLLRERGAALAVKRAARAANQGLVAAAASADGRTVSLVEVNSETDFVARNAGFQAFVAAAARKALESDAPLAETFKPELAGKIAEIGENLVLRRNARFALRDSGKVASYVHLGGKVGVLVEVGCTRAETAASPEFQELVRDLTLHVAAARPQYLAPADVPADVASAEREIFARQVAGKPPQIVEKIVDGKMKKYYAEVCLVDQPFVKEPKQSITELLREKGKALGDTPVIRRFLRYQLGE